MFHKRLRNIVKRVHRKWSLTISLVLFVFGVMVAAFIFSGIAAGILYALGVLQFSLPDVNVQVLQERRGNPIGALFGFIAFSTFLGTAIAAFFSKKALNPIREVINATRKVAEGDFTVRVDIKGIYELEELSRSFNKMAHELSSLETLRGDFVNDFSHEFKTPIVSVRGFAKLLKNHDLTEDERREYLDIIIAESERLAALSTNVLNLSKYENTEIVADKTEYLLDEQIRRVVVMTELRWAAKNISIDVSLDETTFEGNEDFTQQIWLNLMDNAIKFSNDGGDIQICLANKPGAVCFTIKDNGVGMSDAVKARVFDKFYQGDASRAKAGNGLGLSIVKRIVELHGGTIAVESAEGEGSAFTVTLPKILSY